LKYSKLSHVLAFRPRINQSDENKKDFKVIL